ncbi:SUKH-4 family immunity protein [Streptomyces sp. NPDC057950]|uniref:SUKH-4 family immunity protein n=1 Tax=Streptomyces sp. NPDC057950 TaxID=3346288 RepID=UPI0036E972B4
MKLAWTLYDEGCLAGRGVQRETARLLVEQGLPTDCNRMFVRDPVRELEVRELPVGQAVFLGAFEDGVNSYWLAIGSGDVWMGRGHDGDADQQYTQVNSSIEGLVQVLRIWEAFVYSGKSDEDDDYEHFAQDVIDQARRADPDAFADDESWWSRVFEEVELGVLVPEDA